MHPLFAEVTGTIPVHARFLQISLVRWQCNYSLIFFTLFFHSRRLTNLAQQLEVDLSFFLPVCSLLHICNNSSGIAMGTTGLPCSCSICPRRMHKTARCCLSELEGYLPHLFLHQFRPGAGGAEGGHLCPAPLAAGEIIACTIGFHYSRLNDGGWTPLRRGVDIHPQICWMPLKTDRGVGMHPR